MKQVASLAGVSVSTVSRVVNGDPAVAEALAERVREATAALGYRHNVAASVLRRADGISASIGLIVEDVANPFFSGVQRGIEDVARKRGVLTFAGSSDEVPEREQELAEAFGARGVDGLIIAPTAADHSYLLRDRAAGVAVVFVDRPGNFIDADAALVDNADGAYRAVTHLIAGGHRSIGFIGDRPSLHTAAERLRGYRQALAADGLPAAPELIRHALPRAVGVYEQARELLSGDAPPTALFTSQNLITAQTARALHDLGLQHRIALVGFDDLELADLVEPGLTVIAQNAVGLGQAAAKLLFSRIDGLEGPGRKVVLAPTLIERGSGELPPWTGA